MKPFFITLTLIGDAEDEVGVPYTINPFLIESVDDRFGYTDITLLTGRDFVVKETKKQLEDLIENAYKSKNG